MKILYICNEYPPAAHGGIGTFTKFLAESLARLGHEVAVVGCYEGVEESVQEVCNGLMVYRRPAGRPWAGRFGRLMSFLRERKNLSATVDSLCASFAPDIVESHDWAGPLLRKPGSGHVVVRMHGANTVYRRWMGLSKKRSRLLAFFEKRNLGFGDSLVAVSGLIRNKTAETFRLPAQGINVIYNGVDVKRFAETDANLRDRNRLLFVGRVHHHKGLDLLFKALKIVFRANRSVYLDVVGGSDPAYLDALKANIPGEALDRINFVGRVCNESLPDVYSAANISLVPSRVEAFPIVPLESMACRTPVIMSSLVAASEIIDDEVDGYISDPLTPTEYADCILRALADQQQLDRMRANARTKIVENFSLEKIAAQNEDFYKNII